MNKYINLNKTVCWHCDNSGHVKPYSYKQEHGQDKSSGNNDITDSEKFALLVKESPKEDLTLTVW